MVSSRSSMAVWALLSAAMVFCTMADQRTEQQAKPSKDLLSALDNADLSDLLENDLDETFLFRRRSHATGLKNLKNLKNNVNNHNIIINKDQVDRLLQAEEGEGGGEATPVMTPSPTPSSASGGEGGMMFSGAPTASPTSMTDRMVDIPSASPTASPTGLDDDGGLSRDASAAWRPTSRLLIGGGGVVTGMTVVVAVVSVLTMTVMVAL